MSERATIVAIILTNNRPKILGHTLRIIVDQTVVPEKIIVVDTGNLEETRHVVSGFPSVEIASSKRNIGGAGGFALGILLGMATGHDYIWLTDDDGAPETLDCLERLRNALENRNLDIACPIIVDPDDHSRLSFPYRVSGTYCYDRAQVQAGGNIPAFAHLFNGCLMKAGVPLTAGLPDIRLFIRGDEVEFLHRALRSRMRLETIVEVAFVHPSGMSETVGLIPRYLHAVVPLSDDRKFYFFRNRGYIVRKHRLIKFLLYDILRYFIFYIVFRKGDWRGLRFWWNATLAGLRGDFNQTPDTNVPGR